jgi:hypothetical protein
LSEQISKWSKENEIQVKVVGEQGTGFPYEKGTVGKPQMGVVVRSVCIYAKVKPVSFEAQMIANGKEPEKNAKKYQYSNENTLFMPE